MKTGTIYRVHSSLPGGMFNLELPTVNWKKNFKTDVGSILNMSDTWVSQSKVSTGEWTNSLKTTLFPWWGVRPMRNPDHPLQSHGGRRTPPTLTNNSWIYSDPSSLTFGMFFSERESRHSEKLPDRIANQTGSLFRITHLIGRNSFRTSTKTGGVWTAECRGLWRWRPRHTLRNILYRVPYPGSMALS